MQLLCLYIKFFYVFHANVTDFDGVPIEDFVKFVCLREVFVDEVEKGSFNVGSYVSAVGGGGLYQMMFLWWFLCCRVCDVLDWSLLSFSMYVSWVTKFLHLSASS